MRRDQVEHRGKGEGTKRGCEALREQEKAMVTPQPQGPGRVKIHGVREELEL